MYKRAWFLAVLVHIDVYLPKILAAIKFNAISASFCINTCSADVIATRYFKAPSDAIHFMTSLLREFFTRDANNRLDSPVFDKK